MFSKEIAVLSCNDMNKVKVGAAAVSRYHQLSHYFELGDSPNLLDHDFPVPGYLLIPSGYMLLENRCSNQETSTQEPYLPNCQAPQEIVFADFREYDLLVVDSQDESHKSKVPESQRMIAQGGYTNEKLMHPHVKHYHTGSALVTVQAQNIHQSNVGSHANDLYTLLGSLKQPGKSAIVLTVDGSPD